MSLSFRRNIVVAAGAACTLFAVTVSAPAQEVPTRGFDIHLAPAATGEELSTIAQFWALDVDMKPMRMIVVNVRDPETGEMRRERIWYLVYRANNRPVEARVRPQDRTPVNVEDSMPTPIFAPDFTLVTNDGGKQQIYEDVIIPEAQAAIERRERMDLKNTVEIMGPLPEAVAEGEESADTTLNGVAMWRGIDPHTDYFTIYATGFSNGYRLVAGPGDEPLAERRTIMIEYWVPGDELRENEREFRIQGDPTWIYRVANPITIPATADAAMAAEGR